MKKEINFICSKILSDSLFSEAIARNLTGIGFLYPENAWSNLKKVFKFIRRTSDSDKILLKLVFLITESFEPDRGLNNFEKFLSGAKSPERYISIIQDNEEFLKNIIALFSGSQFLSDIAVKDERNINFLVEMDIDRPEGKENLLKEIKNLLSSSYPPDENYSIIRKFKNQEFL
ncbi:MAG: hypothetical protein HWN67_10885, partial [Candidatus Helarchaeota archaeon]|nr:hypothetical protein [Candidatus Helarchaeota archaeon]